MRLLITSCALLAACGIVGDKHDAAIDVALPADAMVDMAIDPEIDADAVPPPEPIALGLIIAFDGACPSGFTERTDLANRFLRGHDGDATYGETGGTAMHTHTVPAHSHGTTMAGAAHQHQVTFGPATQTTIATPSGALLGVAPEHTHTAMTNVAGGPHTHPVLMSAILTTGVAANDPMFREVVLCEVTGAPTLLPTTALVLESSTCPLDWTLAASTEGRLLRGHDLDGTLAEVGGTAMHSHVMSHGHATGTQSADEHTHTATAGAASIVLDDLVAGAASIGASSVHSHTITITASHYHTVPQYVGSTMAASGMPEYREVLSCQPPVPALLPENAFALSMGPCPTGWIERIEFRNRFLGGDDGDASSGEVIGGPHTHVATHDHGMTGPSDHAGVATAGPSSGTVTARNSTTRLVSSDAHTHAISVSAADMHAHATLATSPAVNAVEALPPYTEVVVCARE